MDEERNVYFCTNVLSGAGYLDRSVCTVMVQGPGAGARALPPPYSSAPAASSAPLDLAF